MSARGIVSAAIPPSGPPMAALLSPEVAFTRQLLTAASTGTTGYSPEIVASLAAFLGASLAVDGPSDFLSPAQRASAVLGPDAQAILNPGVPTFPADPGAKPPATPPLTGIWASNSAISTAGVASRQRYGPVDGTAVRNRIPTAYPSGAHFLFGVMDPRFQLQKVGLVLSGGASHGSFQMGAVQYVYGNCLGGPFPRPDVIAGTSVGAINGTKLAEGYADSVGQLQNIWAGLRGNADMYRPNLDLDQILQPLSDSAQQALGANLGALIAGGLVVSPLTVLVAAVSIDAMVGAAAQSLRRLDAATSLYSLSPIRALLRQYLPYWSQTGPGRRGAGICVGRDSAGRTVVAARGYDDACYVALATGPGAGAAERAWSHWLSLGGGIDSDPSFLTDQNGVVTGVAVRLAADGLVSVLQLTGSDPSERASWSDAWEPLGYPSAEMVGEASIGGPGFRFATGPTCTFGGPGNTSTIVVLGYEGFPWYNEFDSAAGRWRGWWTVGNWPSGHTVNPAMATGVDGSAWFFGKLVNGEMVRLRLAAAAESDWVDTHDQTTSRISLAANGDGHLHAVCVGSDNGIWVLTQTPDGLDWEPSWQRIGESSTSDVATVLTPGNTLSIFIRGLDYAIWTKTCGSPSGPWADGAAGWHSLGTPPSVHFIADPVVLRAPSGTREVYCVANDRHVYANYEVVSGGSYAWSGWQNLGGTVWTGIELRLATVSLETGSTRYVDEAGRFTDAADPVVGVSAGTMASAAIPGIFEPVVMDGQTYVDGGCRDGIPIWAALDAGADVVYAIECSAALSNPLVRSDPHATTPDVIADIAASLDHGFTADATNDFTHSGVAVIGMRAVMGILPNSIVRNELEPRQPWPKPVYVIEPGFDIHDAMTIDAGLIAIAEAYGWMRASDVITSADPVAAMPTSDAIALARRDAWWKEALLNSSILGGAIPPDQTNPAHEGSYDWDALAVADRFADCRRQKQVVAQAVAARASAGFELPADADGWAGQWENPQMRARSPHGPAAAFSYTMGNGQVVSVPAM